MKKGMITREAQEEPEPLPSLTIHLPQQGVEAAITQIVVFVGGRNKPSPLHAHHDSSAALTMTLRSHMFTRARCLAVAKPRSEGAPPPLEHSAGPQGRVEYRLP